MGDQYLQRIVHVFHPGGQKGFHYHMRVGVLRQGMCGVVGRAGTTDWPREERRLSLRTTVIMT